MAGRTAVVGVYEYIDDLLSALRVLKREKVPVDSVYSPMPRHEIREELGIPELGTVRFFTLTGGFLGILTGIFLAWYCSIQWYFIVGGKPPIPIAPTVIPAFEFFILISVFFNLAGILIKNRMPRLRLPAHFDPRFTQDRFGILVFCPDEDRDRVAGILTESGAEEVRRVDD